MEKKTRCVCRVHCFSYACLWESLLTHHQCHLLLLPFYPQEVVFEEHAKLYIHGETLLDQGTGNKTWREWTWTTSHDFAHGELVETVFAMKCCYSEIANEFKMKFTYKKLVNDTSRDEH